MGGDPLYLDLLADRTRAALAGADLALVVAWRDGPLWEPEDEREPLARTLARIANYELAGWEHAYPPRGRCARCGRPTGWSRVGTPGCPWSCGERRGG